jgi:uroporphyrinogen-III decarboxylase
MQFTPIEPVIEGAKAFLANKGELAACALIFLGIDPCWHSMGWETFGVACLTDPGLVEAVLGPISDWYAEMAAELCKLDFDFIWAADDIAFKTAPFFSPQVYRDLLLPHTQRVADQITKPWIYHSDGNLLPIWDDLTGQGMDAIHPLEAGSMDVAMLKEAYGEQIAFCGGVDLRILEAGTPEETVEDTQRLIDILGPGGGYLLCTSNSVTPHVKPENPAAMLQTLFEYGRYPLSRGSG